MLLFIQAYIYMTKLVWNYIGGVPFPYGFLYFSCYLYAMAPILSH